MRDYGDARIAVAQPVEIEEVVVGCLDPFALILSEYNAPEQRREDGLKMSVKEKKGGKITQRVPT